MTRCVMLLFASLSIALAANGDMASTWQDINRKMDSRRSCVVEYSKLRGKERGASNCEPRSRSRMASR